MNNGEMWRRGPMGMDPKLDIWRLPASDLCWWCGGQATTSEHRFKRKTLQQRAQNPDGSLNPRSLFKKSPDFEGTLRSIDKGAQVQWRKNLCANCNNAKSQPFDLAYDKFDAYLLAHFDEMMLQRRLQWSSIYGAEDQEGARHLARYFAKQMGCMLATQQLPIPQELIGFLNGAEQCPSIAFKIFIDTGILKKHKKMLKNGDVNGLSTLVSMPTAPAYQKDGQFARFTYHYRIGYMGIIGDWQDGESQPSWFDRPVVRLSRQNDGWAKRSGM